MTKMTESSNVVALDSLANLPARSETACGFCGSHQGTLKPIGRSGKFWLICECGWNTHLSRWGVYGLIRERRAAAHRRDLRRAL
jgi:hypothetical protein